MIRPRHRAALLTLLVTALPVGLTAQTSSAEELQRFSAVLNYIRVNYVDSVTYHTLVPAAIDGMLHSLDPHSWFLSREQYEKRDAVQRGELAVIGVSVEIADGSPTVLDVEESSPAERADVRPGDRLISVDGLPTAGMNAEAITLRLAGDKGSKVHVRLERGSRLEPDSVSVTIRRETPRPQNFVRIARMADPTTGYLRLGEFGPKSASEVEDAIKHLKGEKAQRVILDLRGNPGGIVTEAVAMASSFLPANTLVFSTKGRQPSVNAQFRTKTDGAFQSLPLVVLVDQGSASAAEALTGSLQDHDRAVVAGRRTFGKALMQTSFLLQDGMVELTIGHVLSPSGRYIQRPYSGLQLEQYYAFAGDSSWQDSTRVYHTDHGRTVRGGGGIAPDVVLPAPPPIPRWFTVAADSGWDRAVADSVANSLGTDALSRATWINGSAIWSQRLLPPLLDRIRSRLHVAAQIDLATDAAMARRLAAATAAVRWGDDASRELLVRNDPDIVAALALFDRSAAILGSH